MDEVELGEFLEDEGQRLQYIFDTDEDRGLLLEVSHIAYGKHIDSPICRRSHGTAPALILASPSFDPVSLLQKGNITIPEGDDDDLEPTDDDLFDIEEIDLEGFDFTEG